MKQRARRSGRGPISETRWLPYAIAAAATMLAGNQAAEAAIHYSGLLNVRLPRGQNKAVNFPLNEPGNSLRFEHLQTSTFGFQEHFAGFKVALKNGSSGEFRDPRGSIDFAPVSRLQHGDAVSDGNFYRGLASKLGFGTMAYDDGGYFTGKGIGYIGFRFGSREGVLYGWVRVRMQGPDKANAFEMIDYAYGDPGDTIFCGQKSSNENAMPSLGSLGLLAVGAAGLLAWRAQRKPVA
ncbi:MAG TPA: hypothetical protein VGG02_06860 [Chthoniobacterales bacterium]|jgi:hypothetical protein